MRLLWCDIPKKVPHDRLKDIPGDKDVNVPVFDVSQRDRAGKLVDETHAADENARDG